MKPDCIVIKRLQLSTHIGVPDEERATAQDLCVSVQMWPEVAFEGLEDEMEKGVNYYEVSQQLKSVAAEKPRKLIETLAIDLAYTILKGFAVQEVEVSIEKYILSDTDFVGVVIHRDKSCILSD